MRLVLRSSESNNEDIEWVIQSVITYFRKFLSVSSYESKRLYDAEVTVIAFFLASLDFQDI